MALTIGIDVGGTKVAGGVVDDDGAILAEVRRATPSKDAVGVNTTIEAVVRELAEGREIAAVGLGAAGFVDVSRSKMLFSANVSGWRDEPLRQDIVRRTGLPVVVENDANAAAWGEARFGAGRGKNSLACVTVGTGIGGAIVAQGQLYRGAFGIGGEFGHMRVEVNGRRCACGRRGCWEQYASGSALVREARERASEDREGAEILLDLSSDGTPESIIGPMVTAAAQRGDPVAIAAFDAVGRWLGYGMADLASVLDPGCFIIGGGVCEAGDLLLGPSRDAFRENLPGAAYRPVAEIRPAELGNSAGIVGAADLARH